MATPKPQELVSTIKPAPPATEWSRANVPQSTPAASATLTLPSQVTA